MIRELFNRESALSHRQSFLAIYRYTPAFLRGSSLFAIIFAVLFSSSTEVALSVPYDENDIVIAGFTSDTISVNGADDCHFKGNLVGGFNKARGLDFDGAGNLVAVGATNVRVFDITGAQISQFTNSDLFAPVDLKVGPSGNYYVGTQLALLEVSPAGVTLRVFDTGDYDSVAILPGSTLWAGSNSADPEAFLRVFDRISGTQTGTIVFDNGQSGADSMFYSVLTNTILITDDSADAIFERMTDGTFIRKFSASGFNDPAGVTRGLDGEVLASDAGDQGVYRWNADGTFESFVSLAGSITSPAGIVWTGNMLIGNAAPIPAVSVWGLIMMSLLVLVIGTVVYRRRIVEQ